MKRGSGRWVLGFAASVVVLLCAYGTWLLAAREDLASIAPARPSTDDSTAARKPRSALVVPPVPMMAEERTPTEVPSEAQAPPAESVHARLERLMKEADLLADEKGWDQAYARASVEDMKGDVRRIEDLIYEATKDEFEYRFSIGLGAETVSRDGRYEGQDFDPTSVYWVRMYPDGRVVKVTLPKEEFPEVYELKARSAWLRNRIQQKGVPSRKS